MQLGSHGCSSGPADAAREPRMQPGIRLPPPPYMYMHVMFLSGLVESYDEQLTKKKRGKHPEQVRTGPIFLQQPALFRGG